MRLLFAIIGLLGFSLSATAAREWLYYKEYPWVYDAKSEDWLYLRGAADGSIYAYRNSTKEWEEFTVPKDDDVIPIPSWYELYEGWVQNPEPYGGVSVLRQIKEAKDNMSEILDLSGEYGSSANISDLTPLSELTNLTKLILFNNYKIENIEPLATLVNLIELNLTGNKIYDISFIGNLKKLENLQLQDNQITDEDLSILTMLPNLKILNLEENEITDYSPLAALTNLTDLRLGQMTITASQKEMLEAALPNTRITWPHPIIDDSEPAEKTWDELYEEWVQNPEPYGGLSVLQQIKQAKDSGAWQLVLENKNISDISPLDGLTQFYYLNLEGNIIADISSLASLTNLESLDLDQNNIADVSPLAGLTTLTGLELGGNNITNLTALSSLTNLNYLDLDGNPLSSEQKNLITEALPNTDLWFGN